MEQAEIREGIVDNRTFVLGLDWIYRSAMKRHEAGELLRAAREVAKALGVGPAAVPVEGYYTESLELTEYFRLTRALQHVHVDRTREVAGLTEFERLIEVTASPIYGRAIREEKLLPVGYNALTRAMKETEPDWTVSRVTRAAHRAALAMGDYSLVGLAARLEDSVVLASLGESVVLYSAVRTVAGEPLQDVYVWQVDPDLVAEAWRFNDEFFRLFGERLVPPEPENAAKYWVAARRNKLVGRCVRLGEDLRTCPVRYYHWGVRFSAGEVFVQDFWDSEVWTTERFRAGPPPLDQRG